MIFRALLTALNAGFVPSFLIAAGEEPRMTASAVHPTA